MFSNNIFRLLFTIFELISKLTILTLLSLLVVSKFSNLFFILKLIFLR